jgi:hypothetical protein
MATSLAVNDRVWHESEQFTPPGNRRYGTVKAVGSRAGRQSARVQWDGNTSWASYPIASLTKAETGR